MPARVRLLALDIDGTLLDTRYQLPPRNREALEAAHRAGVEIVLVTGRRYAFALPVAELLPFDLVLMASNGAVIRSRSGQPYERFLLPVPVAASILDLTRPWLDYALLAYDVEGEGQLVIESMGKRTPNFLSWLERNRRFVDFAPLEATLAARGAGQPPAREPEEPLQVMYSGPLSAMRGIATTLDAAPFRSEFQLTKTFYEGRDLGIMDLIHPACSKGSGLKDWAEHRGIPREQIMAVGDNFNDLEMLDYAGVPVVMGNAVPELQGDGRRVTLDNDSAGLAVAVEQWALPNS